MASHPAQGAWSRERVEQTAKLICDPPRIGQMLEQTAGADEAAVRDVLYRASRMEGLTPREAATLIQVTDPNLRHLVLDAARKVHETSYGHRIYLLAPVCPTNRCVDDCLYCPLRRGNARLKRTHATARDIQREIVTLLDEGHKHFLLVFGNDRSGMAYARDMIWSAYGARSGTRQAHRVDVNLDPTPGDDLRQLQDAAPLGTYHVFQETYQPDQYAVLHPSGPKSDYAWRLTCHNRAVEAGLADVGLGVLLGAGDWRFDVVAVLAHAEYLKAEYGHGPVAITYPRMLAAPGAPASQDPHRQVSDEDFVYVVAVTRLALPYTHVILCTPALRETRLELYQAGISTVSVGSTSYPGVYTADGDPGAGGQLRIGRPRALEELVYRMCDAGVIPSFCTACYTQRRRALVREQMSPQDRIAEHCTPNALLTLKEYLMDYASPETRTVGERLIQRKLAKLPEKIRAVTLELMEEAEAGFRGQLL
jgi:2-iminoacetate synthase